MKILEVCPKFHHSVASGPTKVVYYISQELARRGHSVTVYTSDMRDKYVRMDSGAEEIDGIIVHRFQSIGTIATRDMKIFVTPAIIQRARNEIRSFDVIHFHDYRSFQGTVIHHFARKYSIPYVLQTHGSLPRIMDKKSLKWLYDILFGYRFLKDASKVVALSHLEVEQYKGMGVPEEKIEVIPNGIDLSEHGGLPPKGFFKKKFSIDDNEKIVLYLGRIHESKGLDLLAHAFNIVSKDLSNVRLVVVGPDDGYAAKFSRLISDLGIEEKVLLTGFVEKRSKLAALVDSDVFITPHFHGFPVAFLEACLAECPIVTASNELGWIHDNVGYVVEDSPIALAKAISNILQDERIYRRLRNNCVRTIKNFNISIIASRLENTYKSVVR